jgi:uncharacterized protein YoxC
MTIEWFRDLVIIIYCICGTVAFAALAVLAFILFSRVKPVIDSIKKITDTVERITSSVEEAVAKPITQIISFVQGIRNALGLVKRFTGKKED